MTTCLSIVICLILLPATQQQYQRNCTNGQQCYITPSNMSWFVKSHAGNAQEWCKSMNATLPIVDDSEKQAALLKVMQSLGMTEIWIGATVVYGDWTWVDGTKLGTNILQSLTPGDFVAGFNQITTSTPWHFAPYGAPAIVQGNFICQFSDPEACNKTESVPAEGGCYMSIYSNALPWFSARNHCLEIGGDLATFHNLTDFNDVVKYNEPMLWVGLRNRWWNWQTEVTGTLKEVLFTQWTNGSEPSNTKDFNCISTTSNGWKEANCTEKLAFICQEVFLPDNCTLPSSNSTQIGSCRDNGLAAGLGVGIPIIVIAAIIIIVVIIKRDRLIPQRPVSSTTTYRKKSVYMYDNASFANVTPHISPEQSTQDGWAYEGLHSSQRGARDDAHEALDVQ